MWIERIIFIGIIIMVIQDVLYSKFGLSKIKYKRSFNVLTAYEGQKVSMIEVISNEKLLPVPWLRVESKMDKNLAFDTKDKVQINYDEYHDSVFNLKPFMKVTRKYNILCKKRGYYELNTVTLTCGNLFFNNETFKGRAVDSRLYVYPEIIDVKEIPVPSRNWQGDIIVKRWIYHDPFIVAGIREYQYGDTIKDVNWKASAKTNKLQVNKHDFTADPKLMIYINVDVHENQWGIPDSEEPIEIGIKYAASIAYEALAKGMPVGLGTNGYRKHKQDEPIVIEPNSSKSQITDILETLSQLVILRRVSFYTYLDEEIERYKENRDIIIISTYVDEKINEKIEELRKLGNSVMVLPIESEGGEE